MPAHLLEEALGAAVGDATGVRKKMKTFGKAVVERAAKMKKTIDAEDSTSVVRFPARLPFRLPLSQLTHPLTLIVLVHEVSIAVLHAFRLTCWLVRHMCVGFPP